MKIISGVLAIMFVVASPLVSQATLINISGLFNASGFVVSGSDPVPFDPISGTFDFDYDDSGFGGGNPATLNSLNIVIGPTTFNPGNSLAEVNFSGGMLSSFRIGGSLNTIGGLGGGTPDFVLNAFANSTGSFSYTTAGTNSFFNAVDNLAGFGTTGLSFTSSPVSSVPEPSTMLLMASGLVGLIGWQYRKKQIH